MMHIEMYAMEAMGYAVRIAAAAYVAVISTGSTSELRFHAGLQASVLCGTISFIYLDPLFLPARLEIAEVAPYLLGIIASFVGLALGTLLPKFFPGASLGVTSALLLLCFGVPHFRILGLSLASVGVLVTMILGNACSDFCNKTSSLLIGGGVAVAIIDPNFFPYLRALGGSTSDHRETNISFGIYWLLSFLVMFLIWVLNPNGGKSSIHWLFYGRRKIPTVSISKSRTSIVTTPPFYQFDGGSGVNFNMFDPGNLPTRINQYVNLVYRVCDDIGNFFGFQDSSVRNQAEHLLILISNNQRDMKIEGIHRPASPIFGLHKKVFSNYSKWCESMGVKQNFWGMHTERSGRTGIERLEEEERVLATDLVLFFAIWGEGANIRHMPECLCFLFHKMMEEYIKFHDYIPPRTLYAGHYLDNVVRPIYEVVEKNMKSKADHPNRRNYDDFNEFFWSRSCLMYRYTSSTLDPDLEATGVINGSLPGESEPTISEALEKAPKTFLEKRSWARSILAVYRVLEWHIVTFYLLAVLAFSIELVWDSIYIIKVASGVFWIFNLLHLHWNLLEVWCEYPGIQLSGTSVCGSFFTLVTRFVILVYQTLYLMWTFGSQHGECLGVEGDSTFWWWQYIWISLLVMLPWIFSASLQIYPFLTTMILSRRNDYIQSFLNILFPLSRLYVGKAVHESFKKTMIYGFFWATLIVFKLWFSYNFEVGAMVKPSMKLIDDYLNLPDQDFFKMVGLLLFRWSPQFLVYLVDFSIWYSVWQAFAGTAVGFSEQLGDIRSMSDIRNNFTRAPEAFCKKMLSSDAGSRRGSAASFLNISSSGNNLLETTSLLGSDPHKLQSYVNRLLDVRIQKWVMFSVAWNEIIDHFRQEDLVSDSEKQYLKFSSFEGFSLAIYLPVFQTAGEIENILLELEQPKEVVASGDEEFFAHILKSVTMRTVVSEVWELGSFLMLKMFGAAHNNDIVAVMNHIDRWTRDGSLCEHIKVDKMRTVIKNLIALITVLEKGLPRRKPVVLSKDGNVVRGTGMVESKTRVKPTGFRRTLSASAINRISNDSETLSNASPSPFAQSMTIQKGRVQKVVITDALRDQARDKARALIQSIRGITKDVDHEAKDVLDRLTFLISMENGFLWNDTYASTQLDTLAQNTLFAKVLTKVHGLVACLPDDVEPKSKEVRRRLTFFVNTLFMDMPDAPSIHDMYSWNVLTPYYNEDIIYTKADLEKRTDALGVSTLLYLQTLYRSDWNNFLERMGIKDEEKVFSKKNLQETRRWASLRAQTLSRTVNGMMYYEKALRLLAKMERMDDSTTDDLIGEKFGYIVSCQVYGNMKKNQDPKADDIEQLMHHFPHLRVAYIDSVRLDRSGASVFYSVLVKSDRQGSIQEIYRVRLPGNPVIGEGKPENQNHAIIFSRGEFLQTIDMNQEGYFEEAMKMRNALQEFCPSKRGALPMTILGLREHIFTGSVSSLANYMALQETSFVTLGQRVLTNPLCMRLHYGHPDVFDKLFFMTRGGVSKASKGINLSEDIFAGYSNVIRGGQVGFKEYLQVGKGRDVGMSQIYKFEAKLSQGAAEQSLSRDVYRMSHRLDFCRLFTFYFGGIGHYFSNVLTVLTVYVVTYLVALLAIYDIEVIGDQKVTPVGTLQMLLGGLGLLQTIPLIATLGVERGWLAAVQDIFSVFVTGGPLHFMFHIQTKAHYMAQTILVGGAKYRPTGRGFVTQHTPMDEQFRFFASSHLYLGFELAMALILMGLFTGVGQYVGRSWSLWLAAVSFIASPFWFNPLTFDWGVASKDYSAYMSWMTSSTGGTLKSWSFWWNEENSHFKTLAFNSKVFYTARSAIWIIMANGIRKTSLFHIDIDIYTPTIKLWKLFVFILLMIIMMNALKMCRLSYAVRRSSTMLLSVLLVVTIVLIFVEDENFFRFSLAGYYVTASVCQIGLLMGMNKIVKQLYFVHDLIIGHIIFFFLFLLSATQVFKSIQTWLLFHNALSTDVVVSDILRFARKNQESGSGSMDQNDDLVEQITELKKMVVKQEEILRNGGLVRNNSGTDLSAQPANAVAALVAPSSDKSSFNPVRTPRRQLRPASSMTGMDVYKDMAVGMNAGSSPSNSRNNASNNQPQASNYPGGAFEFSQPDAMPPR